jgi:hypothetical protein
MTQEQWFFESQPWFDQLGDKLEIIENLLEDEEDEENKYFWQIFSDHLLTIQQIRSLSNNKTFKSDDDMKCFIVNTDMLGISCYTYIELWLEGEDIDEWEDVNGSALLGSACYLSPTEELLKAVNKYLQEKNAL